MIKELAVRFKEEFYQLERAIFGKEGAADSGVVQFTSSHFGEGVSSITLALALFMARLRPSEEVMVVEANLRRPCFDKLMSLKTEGSLLAVLQRSGRLVTQLRRWTITGFG